MKSQLYSLLKFLIGWPLSIIALIFIIKLIAPHSATLLTTLQHLNIILLLLGILCFIVFYFGRSYIWYRLIRAFEYKISFKESSYLWATSELKRYIPGNVWSFLGRAVLFSEKGVTKQDIAKCLMIEAEIFIISAAIISLFALPFLAQINLFPISGDLQMMISVLVCLGALLYIFNHKVKIKKLRVILPPFTPREIFLLLGVSCVSLVFFGVGSYLSIISFLFIDPQLVSGLSGFFVLSLLLGYLSILTPAGFGVREGIVIAGLTRFTSVSMAAFASLFSRVILIVSELIFIMLAWFWHRTKSKHVSALTHWIEHHKHETILIVLFLIYSLYFSTISFLRFDNFYTGKFDLGNMVQTVWNTANGRVFEMTNPNGTEIVSRLAFHADFLLILLTPFYWVWPSAKVLLLIQTLVVGAGAFFVYFIARDVLKNKHAALLFGFVYLINPSVQRSNLYDFHAVTLATTFLLATYYFFRKKQYVYFSIFAVLAAISKEQVWLIIALFGALVFIAHKKRLLGAGIFLSSAGMFYFFVSYAIPHSLGSQHFALSYYSDFGDGPLSIIKTIILSPDKIISVVLQESRLDYLRQLFAPLGYLSVFAPLFLIFAGPDFLINLLSNNDQLHQIYYQYTATITPFLFLAAIYGVNFLKRYLSFKLIMTYLCIVSLCSAYQLSPLPGSLNPNLDMITQPVADREFIEASLARIPQSVSVAASNNAGSHLSERQKIYILPLGIDKADVIVLLLNNSEPPDSLKAEEAILQKLKKDKNYELVEEKGSFFIFKKTGRMVY